MEPSLEDMLTGAGDDLQRVLEVRKACVTGELRRLRLAAQARLPESAYAVDHDLDPSSFSRWERGECLPSGERALRLADLLDLFRQVVGSSGEPPEAA
jgi:hypothetical protein